MFVRGIFRIRQNVEICLLCFHNYALSNLCTDRGVDGLAELRQACRDEAQNGYEGEGDNSDSQDDFH